MQQSKNLAVKVGSSSVKARLLKKLVSKYGYWLGGFYTEELRTGGEREGFLLKTPRGGSELLASKNFVSGSAFGKYGVKPEVLEGLGVRALAEARRDRRIALLDELGPLILLSDRLSAGVLEALGDESVPCLATFRRGAGKFEDAFAKMGDTAVLYLDEKNAGAVEAALAAWLEYWIAQLEGKAEA